MWVIATEKIVREILVNVSARETRIAVLENGQLMEVRFERGERVVGNIYKGVVQNVLPGMDAAFVNIGLERNAFLYVGDILPDLSEADELSPPPKRSELRRRNISELLKVGQEILVQVIKAPRGTKGARVTTRITLPGRYVVLMPDNIVLGVSRKIEDRAERERLRQIGQKLHPPGFGLIIRTEAEGKTEKEIGQDIEYLTELWQQIRERIAQVQAPALVHRDASLLYRVLRDVFSSEVERFWIDDPEEYEKVHEVLKVIAPELRNRVILYDKPTPMFEHFNIEKEMERLLRRKVWLKSGGYLTIDETEAFTAIDVNTGKYTGKTSLAETILKTNLEAVEEICRQLRLRDIGGIIVIDFIDMGRKSDHRLVMQALRRTLKRDRARFRIGRISSLGLVELTRKRTGESVTEGLTRPCPTCHGRGRIPSPETVSLWIERELESRARTEQVEAYLIEAHPSVVEYLVGEDGVNIDMLEHHLEVGLFVRARPELPIDEYRIQAGTLETLKQQYLPYKLLQVVECQLVPSALNEGQKVAFTHDGYLILWENEPPTQPITKVKISEVRRSFAFAEPVYEGRLRKAEVM
ncbi:MAG: Rne/Rng family ribonuclease [Fimbriimonadales bacterium]|nr:Rne/Rng family ribonuclease [Fimbriimonadales bacterium]MDW8051345.1 Rne/Rng family ribonuclease [Armatimonadota bacterium]